MNEQELEPQIRRIVVALDASIHSLAALEAASMLASMLNAELVGVFVEDINLLRLAGLPFAREISQCSPLERPLDQLAMERQLRLQADKVRQALAEVATRQQLKWSLRIVRGQVAAELLTAAAEADLFVLGKASWVSTRQVRLGSTARTVVTQASHAVLLLQQGGAICAPIQVVYDGLPAGAQALSTATHLIATTGGQLIVIILADSADTAQRLEEEATERLRVWPGQVNFRRLINPTAEALARFIRITGGGTLVMRAQHPLLEGEGLQTVLGAIECTALLVR
jgi:nucleotide-binding universal stress UspA family protein